MFPFTWFENPRLTDEGLHFRMWFLVHDSGRVLATIDGPTEKTLCYCTTAEDKSERLYLHLEGAKEWCERQARIILSDDLRQRALKRRERHGETRRKLIAALSARKPLL